MVPKGLEPRDSQSQPPASGTGYESAKSISSSIASEADFNAAYRKVRGETNYYKPPARESDFAAIRDAAQGSFANAMNDGAAFFNFIGENSLALMNPASLLMPRNWARRLIVNEARNAAATLVGHHSIPRAIQKELPPSISAHPDVRGRPGNPNIMSIPESKHKQIHSSPPGNYYPGGDYNRRFDELIRDAGGYDSMTARKTNRIRDQVVAEFGL